MNSSAAQLSKYFGNNPPSLFDDLNVGVAATSADPPVIVPASADSSHSSSQNITFQSSTELETENFLAASFDQHLQVTSKVSDAVRDMWEPPHTEPGIPPLLTMPGVQSPSDLTDPIREAVLYLLGETEANHRKVLTADSVTQDERGLRHLIENNSFRAAVNLTGRLLTIYGQGQGRVGQPAKHTPHSLQLWFTRFALLIKLRQFDLCELESEPFDQLNRADVYYEFYPEMYSGRKGSMASFSFRLLLAELPTFLGSPTKAITRLTELSLICTEIRNYYTGTDAEAAAFWQQRENRVLHSLINSSLLIKDFSLADHLMEQLIAQPDLENRTRRALYSAWGRIYLQCGDVFGAERKFSEARRTKDSDSTSEFRDLVDKGLIAVAQNDFQTAYGYFEQAIKVEPTNTMLLNNMGVCRLYAGKLKEAIGLFENAVISNPQRGLNESLLLNLSTLYELESSNDVIKKLALLKQINRHGMDLNINLEHCLKLQTSNKIN